MQTPKMDYRPLGRCGTKVSLLSLGGWTTFGESLTDERTARRILYAAYDAGVNFFDIADAYGRGNAERLMGSILSDLPRHRLVISSKVFFPMSDDVNDRGLSRKHVVESVERSLERIGTDYLDLYFCHRFDEHTPIEETARAMDDLVHQGKVIYWGTSEWTGKQIKEVCEFCDKHNLYRPQVEQPQYSLVARTKFEEDTVPALEKYGMGSVVWSPLASGLLTGKYDDGIPADSRLGRLTWVRDWVYSDEKRDRVKQFRQVAEDAGCTRAQLAIAWAAANPAVSSVILGATSLNQLHENLAASRVPIDGAVRKKLDALFPPDKPPKPHKDRDKKKPRKRKHDDD